MDREPDFKIEKNEDAQSNYDRPLRTTEALDSPLRKATGIQPQLTRKMSLFDASYFNSEKHENKESDPQVSDCWKKFKKIIKFTLKNKYSEMIIIILSLFSLFEKNILVIACPISADKYFHLLMDIFFCILCYEFLFHLLIKKHYIGTFIFYLDFLALISLFTETHFFWLSFLNLVTGTKATKQLKILSLLNYIKVVRIAKIVYKSKDLEINFSTTRENQTSEIIQKKKVSQKMDELGIRFRRKNLITKMSTIRKNSTQSQLNSQQVRKKSYIFSHPNRIPRRSINLKKKMSLALIPDTHYIEPQTQNTQNTQNNNKPKPRTRVSMQVIGNFNLPQEFRTNKRQRSSIHLSPSGNSNYSNMRQRSSVFRSTFQKNNSGQRGSINLEKLTNFKHLQQRTPKPEQTNLNSSKTITETLQNHNKTKKRSSMVNLSFKNKNLIFSKENVNRMSINELSKNIVEEKQNSNNNNNSNLDESSEVVRTELRLTKAYKKATFGDVDVFQSPLFLLKEIQAKNEEDQNNEKMLEISEKNSSDDESSSSSKSQSNGASVIVVPNINSSNSEKNSGQDSDKLSANALPSSLSQSDDFMDAREEKKMRNRIDLYRRVSHFIKMENNQENEEEEQEDRKKQENLEKINIEENENIGDKLKSQVEKILIKNVYNQILFVILLVSFSIYMIDIDFIFPLIYSEKIIKNEYCLNILFYFMNRTLSDINFLTTFAMTLKKCLGVYSEDTNGFLIDNIIYLSFNESSIFSNFNLLTGYFNSTSIYRGNGTWTHSGNITQIMSTNRAQSDYQVEKIILDDFNNLTYIYQDRDHSVTNSIFTMVNLIFVSFLLYIVSYYSKKTVHNLIIIPLDIIYTKLQMNLKNLDIENPAYKILEDQAPEDFDQPFEMDDIFQNSNIDEMNVSRVSIAKPVPKITTLKTYGIETCYIDFSLHKLFNMISLSTGKYIYPIIPYAELENDFILNLATPFMQYEAFTLSIFFCNMDKFYSTYREKANGVLSKISTVFHSLGVIFLGEPFIKNEHLMLLWRKEKRDWKTLINRYAMDLIKDGDESMADKDEEDSQINEEEEEKYEQICADLAVFCGIKFLYELHLNLKSSLQVLIECGVEIKLVASSVGLFQGFLGNQDMIELVNNASVLNERYLEVDSKYPSLFIHGDMIEDLSHDLKNFIFPYDFFLIKERRVNFYRHYFNYTIKKDDVEWGRDRFVYKNLKKETIFQKRRDFQAQIIKNGGNFLSFVISDDNYTDIVKGLKPTYRSLLHLFFESFDANEIGKCKILIEDLLKIIKSAETNKEILDPVFTSKVGQFARMIEEKMNGTDLRTDSHVRVIQ